MSPRPRAIGLTVFVATMLACVLVAASVIIGRATASAEPLPGTLSADAGFARDMQVHHDQAVQMSMIVRDRTDDPEVRLLAYDIATSQSQQSGQMFGWLASWGLSQASPEAPMTWMHRSPGGAGGHDAHVAVDPAEVPATMPGMASREDLDVLRELSGRDAERRFLELMIAHHEGGVEMAEAVLDRSSTPVVVDLAGSIVRAQRSEIGLMQDLLAARSGVTP
ncbi:DUF305 domain-containing protein [Leucobacter rhizosphaerae]|uniref:DUF305 domain-containing protein n=1 Tax=Leucobacter rhizosphaerae TaxID=2932245 RepID=A0ABY4FT37_9MICO|nr:DUF305 domain-containing protein [Leucobacter rhizosphaerae]UOQ59440.1 DUF305 domain-containing protein [Leucobacter rhizosphaerae]